MFIMTLIKSWAKNSMSEYTIIARDRKYLGDPLQPTFNVEMALELKYGSVTLAINITVDANQ
uniref:Uncharacterized protein n=1 Tax=Arion vulgaris TaxID=1028688 RepID=A0A0B7AGM7_9EUPU